MTTAEIYVRLLDEGAEVYRPAPAEYIDGVHYRILPIGGGIPEGDRWEFEPGTLVRCEKKSLSDGEAMVAVERVESTQA